MNIMRDAFLRSIGLRSKGWWSTGLRCAGLLIALMVIQSAAAVDLTRVQISPATDKTRIIFELTNFERANGFSFTSSRLTNPDRLVLDIRNANWRASVDKSSLVNTPIQKIRQAKRTNGSLRVVMDIEPGVQSQQFKEIMDNRGHLIVEMVSQQSALARAKSAIKTEAAKAVLTSSPTPNPVLALFDDAAVSMSSISAIANQDQSSIQQDRSPRASDMDDLNLHAARDSVVFKSNQNLPSNKLRNIVVAIDPGHGGDDPGAIGVRGTREKQVVLEIARMLQARINKQPGMRAVLTRDGDYFVELARRRYIARQQNKADIFISIHADAFSDRSARGASVFVLSRKGASSTLGAFLAKNENAADQFGGLKVDGDDKVLRSVLADLAMEGSLEHSFRVGEAMLSRLQQVGNLHKNRVEQAAFMVLKSLDIPSVLVETGFISNPNEEQKLTQKRYQQELANALFLAIRSYFENYPLPGTYMAMADAR